jgi:alpha-beta hydrolase superfamily lysophospholipase
MPLGRINSLMPALTDLVPRGKVRSLGDMSLAVTVSTIPKSNGALSVEPKRKPAVGSMVFFPGFGHHVGDHLPSASAMAKQGRLRVEVPPQPRYTGLNVIGYHQEVRKAALKAYDAAAERAKEKGLPPPVVAGYSMGAGAALYVSQMRNVPAVLWAPVTLNGPMPRTTAPVLVIQGGMDEICDRVPSKIAKAQPKATLKTISGATHNGFSDTDRFAFSERVQTSLHHRAQRLEAITLSIDFISRLTKTPAGTGFGRADAFTAS